MASAGPVSQLAGSLQMPASGPGTEKESMGSPASQPAPTATALAPAGVGEGVGEEAAAPTEGVAATSPAGAGGTAPSNGLDAIVADHRTIKTLFYRCDNAGNATEKLAAVRDLVRHISRHASAEERTLYPMVREKLHPTSLGRMLYDRMVMDDQVNKQLLAYLDNHVPSSEAEWSVYDTTLAKFRAIEEEHLSREEADVIGPLRPLLNEAEVAKLGRKWAAAFGNAPTHPHPGGPSAAAGAKLLHPWVGLLDRVRDTLKHEGKAGDGAAAKEKGKGG